MSRLPLQTLRIALCAALPVLGGCLGIDLDVDFTRDAEIHQAIIDQTQDRYSHIDTLALNDEIRAYVDSYIHPRDSEEIRVEKLQDILYGEDFLHIQYSDEKTHTAIEAFHAREGNCLSVMNLYVAMARYVDVDASFQTVDVQPSWDRRGDLLVLSQHINATGRFSIRRRYVVDFTPEIALQQLTASIVTDRQARSLYFNNLGVEALIDNEPEEALSYFKNALFLYPESSVTWNNIGTTYNRLGNTEFAEYGYQMAFATDDSNATAINNLAKHYRRNGNDRLAREYTLAIERFNERNPYYHFARGNVAWQTRDIEQARLSFRRALRLKEEEPDFYLALAMVYAELGNTARAQELRDQAQELVALNAEIYQPSSQKIRIIDSSTILRDGSPGISILLPSSGHRRN